MRYNENNCCGLDFETYGDVNLPKAGLDNYTRDPFFTPLIARVVARHRGSLSVGRHDIIKDGKQGMAQALARDIRDRYIVAHNAPFERKVLQWLGLDYPADRFVDSAVIARAAGAGSKLEAAAPQLLGIDKMAVGMELIKLFSIPGPMQEEYDTQAFVADIALRYPEKWKQFGEYCELDATQGLDIALDYGWVFTDVEHGFNALSMDMNQVGWHVDVDLVKEMKRRYEENMAQALESFQLVFDAKDLNLSSLKQLKEWCAERGIKATSFDEKHVTSLRKRIEKKLLDMEPSDSKWQGYFEVNELLKTKQVLGGSSLKKLDVILANTNADSRLCDQYLHIGAGQTWRTTGRNVQMQNLKRIGDEPGDMSELEDPDAEWDNEELARNLRQVFTATDPNGFLLVGDFSSVESRGLAYQSGEIWKLEAYRQGKDIYKVGASKQFGVPYDLIDKSQRTFGKVGELSCGYQAGPGAVQSFASGMGVELSEGEASKIVVDWRAANTMTVHYWWKLDDMLHSVAEGKMPRYVHALPFDDLTVVMYTRTAPESLNKQVGRGMITLVVEMQQGNEVIMRRLFNGIYPRGRNLCYFKPSELKSGDLWKIDYVDQKTKQRRFYDIYGGKLAGILTQSLCREIFFRTWVNVQSWVDHYPNVKVIGQFHDELVLDWSPEPGNLLDVDMAKRNLTRLMSDPGRFASFPLAADIKSDYRYTK